MENQTTQNQAPTPQPKNPTPSSFPKYLPLILVALIAGVLTSAGTYLALKQSNPPVQNIVQAIPSLTPTPDPTANWKTYTNTKYFYSLQLPQDWKVSNYEGNVESNINVDTTSEIKLNFVTKSDNRALQIRISLGLVSETTTEDYLQNLDQLKKNASPRKINYSLGGVSSYRTVENNATLGKITTVLVAKNRFLYQISSISTNANSQDEIIYDQILSTFKFTDQNQVTSSSIILLSPNGGETLKAGETYILKWNSSGVDKIYFNVVSEGKEFATTGPISASIGQYNWIVPDMSAWEAKNNFKIFIHNNNATNDIRDSSDGTFTIE